MSTIQLSEDQRRRLKELSQNAPELVIHRARLMLAYSEGKPTMQAAREAGISRGRARFWKRQFLAKGMDIFNVTLTRDDIDEQSNLIELPVSHPLVTERAPLGAKRDSPNLKKDIPFPEPRQSIGVSPEDSLAEAGRKVWLYYFAVMLSHEEGTISGENIEELHDMRVATRRMRTAFDIFGPAYDAKIMKHYLKGLRGVGRALGRVRDMDVILENALSYQKHMQENDRAGLEPLLAEWRDTIDRQRSKMGRHLRSAAYQDFKYNFNIFLQAPENVYPQSIQGDSLTSRVRDSVPLLVYSRYATVRAYESILATASVAQLHALRIEFKKFRYTLEYFREILGRSAGQAINELKQLQDHLGELHDADVACQLVRDFLKQWDEEQLLKPIPERLNPEPIVSYLAALHAERYRLISSFPELWVKFNQPEFRQNIAQAISLL